MNLRQIGRWMAMLQSHPVVGFNINSVKLRDQIVTAYLTGQ